MIFFVVVDLGFTAHQDYFTHFVVSELILTGHKTEINNGKVGWKWEMPEKNHFTTRKQNLDCLTWPELGLNPQRWDEQAWNFMFYPEVKL